MARVERTILRLAGKPASRRRHSFIPSLPAAAVQLEDRMLLSAMHRAFHHHALVGHVNPGGPPPNSSVGPIVASSSPFTAPGYPPPNSSVGPIVASSSPSSNPSHAPPNSSVGPIVANVVHHQSPPRNSSVGPVVV